MNPIVFQAKMHILTQKGHHLINSLLKKLSNPMKTMICKEMGGRCDAEIQAETPEEMMEKGKQHVHESQDESHQALVKEMENISEEDMAAWEKGFREKYDATPDA